MNEWKTFPLLCPSSSSINAASSRVNCSRPCRIFSLVICLLFMMPSPRPRPTTTTNGLMPDIYEKSTPGTIPVILAMFLASRYGVVLALLALMALMMSSLRSSNTDTVSPSDDYVNTMTSRHIGSCRDGIHRNRLHSCDIIYMITDIMV